MGSLRTALVAWLAARSQGAEFLLRIEDLDRQRCRPEFEADQLADLTSLGFDWNAPPVRQSGRTALYEAALTRLRERARVYPCFCTRAEIREAASAPHGELPHGAYPGTCRKLSDANTRGRIAAGEPFALRLDAHSEQIRWSDGLLGETSGVVDDFVLVRADGVHAYQLAVVVDDADQDIGQVVRGADLAESTPRQMLLQRLLGFPTPSYAHLALVMGPQGARLAKRDRAATLSSRDEAPARTLAVLAHTLGLARDRATVRSPAELLDEFRLDALPREPVTLG